MKFTIIKRRLEDERGKRAALYKKYKRCVNVVDGIDTDLVTISIGLGVGGISLLSTIIAFGMEVGALPCSLLELIGKYVSRML